MRNRLVFLFIPLIYLSSSLFLHFNYGKFYQGAVDPEYAILYNGVIVGGGRLAINFTDHPATPLIFITAIGARLTHLTAIGTPYVEHFLQNPEKYIHVAVILNCLLIGFSLWMLGRGIYKYLHSRSLALLAQLGVLSSFTILGISARLIPEASLLIPLCFLCLLAVNYLYQPPSEKPVTPLQFAAVIGFGIACKLSFVPMALVPLILLKGWKSKFKFLGFLLLSVVLFAYPLFTNPDKSFSWVFNMFTHSGQHGGGESDFIDLAALPHRLELLWLQDATFLILLGLMIFFSGLYALLKRGRGQSPVSLLLGAFSMGLLVVTLFVLKHFAMHYIMPFYLLKGFMILLLCLAIAELPFPVRGVNKSAINVSGLGVLSTLILISLPHYAGSYNYSFKERRTGFATQAEKVKALITRPGQALIVNAPYWGSPFVEYAHQYGMMMSYRRKTFVKDKLKVKYPDFYLFVSWSEGFNHWDDFVPVTHLAENYHAFYIYSGPGTSGGEVISTRIESLKESDHQPVFDTLYVNPEDGESLTEVRIR